MVLPVPLGPRADSGACRGHLGEAAAQAYRDALALTDNAAEREFLTRRLTEVTAAGT